jgi:hypothetical protein
MAQKVRHPSGLIVLHPHTPPEISAFFFSVFSFEKGSLGQAAEKEKSEKQTVFTF